MELFSNRAQRDLSPEELANLRLYQASTSEGRILFMPVVRRFGEQIEYQARVHVKGAAGPLALTRQTLKRIGAPPDWYDKAQKFLKTLETQNPQLPGEQVRPALTGNTRGDESNQD